MPRRVKRRFRSRRVNPIEMTSRLIIASLLCSLLACFPSIAGNRPAWRRTRLNQRFVAFDWNCAPAGALDKLLRAIGARAIPADRRGKPGTWGDMGGSVRLMPGGGAGALLLATR